MLNAHKGFTPVAGAPPECDTPGQVIQHYHSEGAVRGDRHSPLQHLTNSLNFIS
jgi:hypothetical protein